jgi:hypothetical protein
MKKRLFKNERGPSRLSLRMMPEARLDKRTISRNPYAARIATEGLVLPSRGRPKKGEETGPSTTRSVRFPDRIWERVEKVAKAKNLPVHAALRTAIVEWVERSQERG